MRLAEILLEKPVESSWIANLTHNRPNKTLTMTLGNGRSFSIPGITRLTFERWTQAPSKGIFYHTYIKDKYKLNRIA